MMAKEETRKKILDCALILFSQKGYGATSVKEIASLAEVNEITVFRHFYTKEGLLEEIFKPYLNVSSIYEHLFGHPTYDLATDLAHIGHSLIDSILGNQIFMRFCILEVTFNSLIAQEVKQILNTYETYLTDYLNDLWKRGVVRQVQFELLSQMYLNLVHQFAFSKLEQINSFSVSSHEKDEFVETVVDLFVTRLQV